MAVELNVCISLAD